MGIGREQVAALPGAAVRRARAWTHAHGAGESGLARLIDVHTAQSAGDALVTVALAGTLFFSVPVGEARGRVALYLLMTMTPFAVVAPVIGPALDRLHGRRWAIAGTMAGRAVLALVMASAFGGLALYPAAFGVLVLSKGYGVARGAVVPRVLPEQVTLVSANARLSLSGLAAATVVAPLGAGISAVLGYGWVLRLAALTFVAAAVLALTLPRRVDSDAGEVTATFTDPGEPVEPVPSVGSKASVGSGRRLSVPAARRGAGRSADSHRLGGTRRPRRALATSVVVALRAGATLRALSGFLTLFLAFLIRQQHGGAAATAAVVGLAAAAGAGGLTGTALGARLPLAHPDAVLFWALGAATVTSLVGALAFTLGTGLLVAFVAFAAGSLGKLCVDAVIQRDVAERVRASAFARSETLLQLTWVLGGAVGIALPLNGGLGFGIATAVLGLAAAATGAALLRERRAARAATPPPQPTTGHRDLEASASS